MKSISSYTSKTVLTIAAVTAIAAMLPQMAYAVEVPRIDDAREILLELIEGSFGALIMIVAGLVAIIASAMGAYRAAMSALVVAIGAFILRTMVDVFFGGNL